MRCLLDDVFSRDVLIAALSFIAQGKLPDPINRLVSASRLIALPKDNGDVRPIAMGEAMRRLAAKALRQQKKLLFSSFFSPIQHGVATSGGSEMLVNHIRLLLEVNPKWVLIKSDIKNAFKSVRRSVILQEVTLAHMSGRCTPNLVLSCLSKEWRRS